MDFYFNTMDPVYAHLISGFCISVVGVIVINFLMLKQKLFIPSLLGGIKMFQSTAASTSRAYVKIVPKHVAVIMDGNRRFGKKAHQDPIQVSYCLGHFCVV